MAVPHPLRPVRGSNLLHLGSVSASSLVRPLAAFTIALVGMTAVAGWATGSTLVWLAWIAVGVIAGLVAGSSRMTVLMAPAVVLAYPLAMALGRAEKPVQPDPMVWAVLTLVGGMTAAAGFAVGAAAVERRVGRVTVAAVLVGVLGAVAWGGYSGYVGSNEVLNAPAAWPHCDTPASRFGWSYEAINYDKADDARLVADADGTCTSQGAKAGSAVVAADGVPIAGWYIPAANGADATGPTIVISPGFKSNKTEVLKYAPFFHQRFNVVIVDLRNQGRSGGTVTTFAYNERGDIRAVVDWLERTKHPAWIGAMGNSMGASTVLAAAVDDPRIKALVLDSMHATMQATFGDTIEHERKLPGLPTAWAVVTLSSQRSGVDIATVDPVRSITRVGNRPVLLIHGTNDIIDTVDHAAKPNLEAATAAGVPVTIVYCEGGGHGGLVEKCPALWQSSVDSFFAGIPELQAAGG